MLVRLLIFLVFYFLKGCNAMTLDELVCRRRPDLCTKTFQSVETSSSNRQLGKKFLSDAPRYRPTDFSSWKEYGSGINDGTGMGLGVGPNYGPGLGEVDIVTGVGVQYPFGGIGYRRDIYVGWGGEGRIGGKPFGFGNGFGSYDLASNMPGWPRPRPFTNTWPMSLP